MPNGMAAPGKSIHRSPGPAACATTGSECTNIAFRDNFQSSLLVCLCGPRRNRMISAREKRWQYVESSAIGFCNGRCTSVHVGYVDWGYFGLSLVILWKSLRGARFFAMLLFVVHLLGDLQINVFGSSRTMMTPWPGTFEEKFPSNKPRLD